MSDAPKCPLGENCDLTAAYMAGHERGKDALRNRIAALEAALQSALGAYDAIAWMAEEWLKHGGEDTTHGDEYRAAADGAKAAIKEAHAALEGKQ